MRSGIDFKSFIYSDISLFILVSYEQLNLLGSCLQILKYYCAGHRIAVLEKGDIKILVRGSFAICIVRWSVCYSHQSSIFLYSSAALNYNYISIVNLSRVKEFDLHHISPYSCNSLQVCIFDR